MEQKMDKKEIQTKNAPHSPLYSQGIKANGLVFLSGQIPLDPKTGKLIEGSIEQQFHQVFDNIEAILAAASLSLEDLVRVEIYLADIGNLSLINQLYLERMTHHPKPVRQAMQIGHLPMNAKIEVSCIAVEHPKM
jgi:2-iminobutanoate/2-iminopropanoate deaminase